MIRKYFDKLTRSEKDKIKWRSHEPSRIEAFSDGVFALAVSLLIISLEVPHSSKELIDMMLGFIPFGVCFLVIFGVWYLQYKFFRRYGMHDKLTIILNGILLFIVLSYVYPLKFIFGSMYLPEKYVFSKEDHATVYMLYAGGAAATSLLFTLMYINAYLKKAELKLTQVEIFETVSFILQNAGQFFVMLSFIPITYIDSIYGHKDASVYSIAFFLVAVIARLWGRRRKELFRKRFGDVPMLEPHHGAE